MTEITGVAWAASGIGLDDLWEGEMQGVVVDDTDVLLINVDGRVHAFDDRCPHAATLLSEGTFEGNVLTCRAHLWQFDAVSGRGINPDNCSLAEYPVKIVEGSIFVQVGP